MDYGINRFIAHVLADSEQPAMRIGDSYRSVFREDFLSISEKRCLFYQNYAGTLTQEDWQEMDREDVFCLALPGDEPQMQYGQWNQCFIEDGEMIGERL